MKTKEFVDKVNDMGYDVLISHIDIEVESPIGSTLLSVQKRNQYVVSTDWSSFESLEDEIQAELFGIAVEYASTKPEEREVGSL